MSERAFKHILGMRVDFTTYNKAINDIMHFVDIGQKAYVCIANVHMVMEAYRDRDFQFMVNRANIVTSDGMPLVWALKLLGIKSAQRVYGPQLTLELCKACAGSRIPIGFYGGTPNTIVAMTRILSESLPSLNIVYKFSPPFRSLSFDEDLKIINDIIRSGAKLLFVGLGCPKQEKWMATHFDSLPIVSIGVGAAFDFIAGTKPQAPNWVQRCGMEWFFRFICEPKRLWKRYLYNNPLFVVFFTKQLLLTLIKKKEIEIG